MGALISSKLGRKSILPDPMRYLAALLTGLLGFLCLQLSAQDCNGVDHTILAGSYYYAPSSLTITVGETVAWINEDGFHDVNGNVSVLTGESFGNPEVFSLAAVSASGMDVCMGTHTFTVAGTYNYDCSIGSHAANGMVGTIIVEEAAASGCNDTFACNYDETATSDVDCLYNDGDLDLSEGIWVMASAFLDPDLGCAIEPAQGLLVQMTTDPNEPLSIADTQELTDYINDMVDQGLIDALNALILTSAFDNAVFSFCGGYLSGVAGLNSIEADWDGSTWTLPLLGFTMAPAAEMMDGCPDPAASNYDPCADPDPATCTYESGCNDMAACNYDETATSDVDCIYVDTPYDLSQGVLVGIPFGQYDLDTTATCAVQPINDNPVQMNLEDGQATFIIDDAVIAYFDNAVAAGLVSQEDADFFLNLMQNATMTFCGDTMVATLPVFGEVVSGWTGSHWMITPVGYYIAPISTVPVGCGDPAAENFDLCVINDPTACEYGMQECNDPLACNYDENATNNAGCNYFDTELFTLEENDFVGLVDLEFCGGYATYDDFPIPLGQDSTGGPLYFTLFPVVEDILVANGFEIAAQDLSTVTLSVCDTVMNYNSLVIGDIDMYWDGMGFINPVYGSYVIPGSSIPLEGCPDPSSCNWNPCTHPFYGDECTYAVVGTIEGDSLVNAGTTVTFTGVPAEGNSFDWYSDCDEVVIDGNTITVTGTEDCEICFEESDPDGCEGETCLNLSVVMSVGENGQQPWQFMPNPAADALRVVWGGDATVFEVVDLNGRRVHTATLYRGVTTLDLSSLQPGLYLAGPQGTEPQRLAIQR